jgi:hypothetical protein
MGEEKDHKPEIIMHHNATKSGFDFLDKLVREHTCTTHLYKINEVPPFVIIPQSECRCLCKFICTVDAEIFQLATKEQSKMSVSAFLGEQMVKTTYKMKG